MKFPILNNRRFIERALQIRGYNIPQARQELNKIQNLNKSELLEWNLEQRWEIFTYHYKNNPFYRKIIRADLPEKWEHIPILEKSDYQIKLNKLISTGFKTTNLYKANTSGSLGNPFYFVKNKYI